MSIIQYPTMRRGEVDAPLLDAIGRQVKAHDFPERRAATFDCPDGDLLDFLHALGFIVTGVRMPANEKMQPEPTSRGTFPLVVSLGGIEGRLDPGAFAYSFLGLIAPGGIGLMSARSGPTAGAVDNILRLMGATDVKFRGIGRIPFFHSHVLAVIRKSS